MTPRRVAAAIVLLALAPGITACTDVSPLVDDSRAVAVVDVPVDEAIASLTSVGFSFRDAVGATVGDPWFGTAQVVDREPLVVRYTVADGVRWSDGVPVDAADLLLSWAAGSGALPDAGFDATPSPPLSHAIRAPQLSDDGRTLFLRFDEPTPDWPLAAVADRPAHVIAREAFGLALEGDGSAATAKQAVVDAVLDGDAAALAELATAWNGAARDELPSAGPYRVSELSEAGATLVANPEYRGARRPHLETLVVRGIDAGEELATMAADADVVIVEASPARIAALPDALEVSVAPGARLEQLQLRVTGARSPALDDPRVRAAFLATVPRSSVADAALKGLDLEVATQDAMVVAATDPAYSEVAESNALATEAHPETAADLLAEAGVTSPEVCVLFDPEDPARLDTFALLAAAGAEVGFRVTDCSTPDWQRQLGRPGVADAALLAWDLTPLGADGPAAVLGSTGVANLNGFADDRADALLDELAATDDAGERATLLADLEALASEAGAGIPLYAHPIVTAFGPELSGIRAPASVHSALADAWKWQPR